MRAGAWTVPTVISYVILIVGGSVALSFNWGRKHVLWGLTFLLVAFAVVILEGSYRESRRIEDKHADALTIQQDEQDKALATARESREADRQEKRIRSLRYCLAINLEGKPAIQPRDSDGQPEPGYAFTVYLQNQSAAAMLWEM